MAISEVVAALGASLRGGDARFRGCSTDSRTVCPGELFVALRGPRFDGHRFVAEALARGAAGALVESDGGQPLPTIVVADTRLALGALAAAWRRRFEVPLVAVTGSNGKTTVKEMVAAVLRRCGPVLATRGNLNNDIGVPLTLLRLGREHRFAVVEMGANHAGEIAGLSAMAAPSVGVITQCAPAHLEGFGSVEAVARAKGELLAHVAAAGTVVINADDPHAPLWTGMAGARRRLTFAVQAGADVRGAWRTVAGGTEINAATAVGALCFRLPLLGVHNVMNALAASAAALALAVPLEQISAALAAVRPLGGRLEPKPAPSGGVVIDDSYNANPGSLRAALDVLRGYPGRRWLALGDMAELGAEAADYHRQAGALARCRGVERLYAVGELSAHAVAAFGSGGRHYRSPRALSAALGADLEAGVTLLVKGSRAMRLERVVAALTRGG